MQPNQDARIEARFHLDWPGFTLDVDLKLPSRGFQCLFLAARILGAEFAQLIQSTHILHQANICG